MLLLCCYLAALSSEPNPFQEYAIDEIVPIRIAVRSVLNLLIEKDPYGGLEIIRLP